MGMVCSSFIFLPHSCWLLSQSLKTQPKRLLTSCPSLPSFGWAQKGILPCLASVSTAVSAYDSAGGGEDTGS